MEGILGSILVGVVGLIALAAFVFLINLLIRFVNLIIRGEKRIEGLALVCIRDALVKYAPGAISSGTSGATQINLKRAISELFPGVMLDVMSDNQFEQLVNTGKVFLCLQTQQDKAISSQYAIETAARAMVQGSIPRERLQKSKWYPVATKNTEDTLKAYLVIAGNIPKPPPFLLKMGS